MFPFVGLATKFDSDPQSSGTLMIAGAGEGYIGFNRVGGVGSLVPDIPIHGSLIRLLQYNTAGLLFGALVMQFEDDITSALDGKFLYINGVPFSDGTDGWETTGGRTVCIWTSSPITFVNGVSYTIEVK